MNPDTRDTTGAEPSDEDGPVVDNRSPFMSLVGPILRNGAPDKFAVVAEHKHDNAGGVVHGGMLATLLDNAMGRAAGDAAGGKLVVTIQLNVHFIASVTSGQRIECEATVVRAGSSIIFMQGTLRVGTRTVASADGVWKILDGRPAPRTV